MSNQSIINPDNSKSHLKGIVDVTKLKANTNPSLVQTSFIGQTNKYDRNNNLANIFSISNNNKQVLFR